MVTSALFGGTFKSYVTVTLTSDRTGLVMETGAKVKMRGVQVGRVSAIEGGSEPVLLKLEIDKDKIGHIPGNVEAQIRATTVFGAKYVDLIYPSDPVGQLQAGQVIRSRNVTVEANTVFQLRGVFLEMLLKPMAFGHIVNKHARVNQAAPLLIDQRRGVNFHIDRVTVFAETPSPSNCALVPPTAQVLQYQRLLAAWHEVPEPHRQHLVEGVPQFLDPCLVHMNELTAPVQLADHLRRVLDQIAVLFFQAAHIHHTLFDLCK